MRTPVSIGPPGPMGANRLLRKAAATGDSYCKSELAAKAKPKRSATFRAPAWLKGSERFNPGISFFNDYQYQRAEGEKVLKISSCRELDLPQYEPSRSTGNGKRKHISVHSYKTYL